MKNISRMAAIALIATAMTACENNVVYNHYEETLQAGWEKNDTLVYEVKPIQKEGVYAMDLMIGTTQQYPFTAIVLNAELDIVRQLPVPTQVLRLNCPLADNRGHTRGQGISNYQHRLHVADIPLQENDSLRIRVRHDMKREILPGVSNVGIKIERRK